MNTLEKKHIKKLRVTEGHVCFLMCSFCFKNSVYHFQGNALPTGLKNSIVPSKIARNSCSALNVFPIQESRKPRSPYLLQPIKHICLSCKLINQWPVHSTMTIPNAVLCKHASETSLAKIKKNQIHQKPNHLVKREEVFI